MKRFYWHFECKPFNITQGWGIYNPHYTQYGFTKHNGIDFKTQWEVPEFDLHAPLPVKLVFKKTYNGGFANYAEYETLDEFLFDDGKVAKVRIGYGHLKELPQDEVGTIYKTGQVMCRANNTGDSTGPHTHKIERRIKDGAVIDINEASNTLDSMPYATGRYAQDIGTLVGLIELLTKKVAELTAKLNNK